MSDRDTIGFSQQNAAAQMNELEERMFRLSEALRGLEPENASRLRLALQFSREEQILEQMRETYKFLKDAQLSKAETEVKELIAKLEHLRNLLAGRRSGLPAQAGAAPPDARDARPARTHRQGREARAGLVPLRPGAAQTPRAIDHPPARPGGARPRPAGRDCRHQELVKERREGGQGRPRGDPRARGEAPQRGGRPRNRPVVRGPSAPPPAASRRPSRRRGEVPGRHRLERRRRLPRKRHSACCARSSLAWTNRWRRRSEPIAEAEFRRRAADQAKNHGTAERLSEASARLGDVGVALRKDLIHASASMQSAEQSLVKTAAAPAAETQSAALDILAKARDEFERFHRAAAR